MAKAIQHLKVDTETIKTIGAERNLEMKYFKIQTGNTESNVTNRM